MEPISAILSYLRLGHKSLQVLQDIERQQKDKRDEEVQRTRIMKRAEIFGRNLHSALLSKYYDAGALAKYGLSQYGCSLDGKQFPTVVVTRQDWVGLQVELDGKNDQYELDKTVRSVERVPEKEALAITAQIGAEKRNVWDAPLFRFLNLQLQRSRLKLTLGLSQFFDFLFSLGALEDELVQALIDYDLSVDDVLQNRTTALPLRNNFLPDAEAILNIQNRLCIGGAYVLLAFARPHPLNDYVFLAKKRSAEVATGRDMITLMPMGYHQPTKAATATSEVSLWNSVLREISEEIFGNEEADRPPNRPLAGWDPENDPAVAWFNKNKGHFVCQIVAAGFDLLQGNFNVGILLAVQDLSYLKHFSSSMQLNWEQNDEDTQPMSTKDTSRLGDALTDSRWNGMSRMTLLEGLKRLKVLDASRVRLPKMQRVLAVANTSGGK
jgi:hypothetical protein